MTNWKSPTVVERFWTKVNRPSEDSCWTWTGGKNHKGYGTIWDGEKLRFATHISLTISGRDRPAAPNNHALHGDSCGRDCVNPGHLRWGSNKENMMDRNRLGRQHTNPGQRNHHSKFSKEDVIAIRASTKSSYALAKEYGVYITTVIRARKGVTYSPLGNDC